MAGASKLVHPIKTFAFAVARFRRAVINVDVAHCSLETQGTLAVKAVNSVNASSPVFTRVDLAVVDVYLTVFPSEALEAITFVAIWFVPTFPFILTRVRVAVVNVPFALNTRKAWQTLTLEPVHQVVTLFGVVVVAGRWVDVAFVDVNGAVNSFKTRLTVALVPLARAL